MALHHKITPLLLFTLLFFPIALAAAPAQPQWIEPSANSTDVDGYDFHINLFDMVDADGDTHLWSDYEIWDTVTNQIVWNNSNETNFLVHTHNPDGTFINSLTGEDRLLYNHTYRVRARFISNGATNPTSPWSEWRTFTTRPQLTFENSPFLWTARPGYTVELVATNISMPVNLGRAPDLYEHLPENQQPLLYVTQLYGGIAMVRNDGVVVQYATDLLNYDSFGVFPGQGETGVTGLYVDPITGDLYVSMVYCILEFCNDPDVTLTPSGLRGKVVRFVTNANGDGYTQAIDILTNLPTGPSHQIQAITRGPDGKLYLNTGDALTLQFQAKNTSSLVGKVLRFNDDGTIPSDNPFGVNNPVWAAGFRNPFGAAWKPGTNELFVTNNGPDSDDGIFRVTRGNIFGWCCTTAPGAWHLWAESVAPTAVAFDNGSSGFANSSGTFYVVTAGATFSAGPSYNAKRITQFRFNPDGTKESLQDLVTYTSNEGFGGPVGLTFGDGGLYFTDLYGELGFVGFGVTRGNIYVVKPGVQIPYNVSNVSLQAGISPAPWYPQGLNMIWRCNGLGGSGQYRYDYIFGDGTSWINADLDNTFHTYPANGTYNVSCTVRDTATGQTASASTVFILGSVPPPGGNQTNGTGSGNTSGSGGGSNATVCFSNLQNAPTSCTGGTITTDNWNGCRTIVCTGNSNSLQILACDKPGVANAQYFEMYKQAQTGNGIKICIGETCIQNEGYKKSPNYPLCVANGTNNTGQPPATPQNISFTSTTPTTNPTINEPNNQTFSYTLSNPSGLSTTVAWIVDGVTQGATGTSFQYIGGFTTEGTHNVSIRIQSSQNTIQRTWMLTVIDTPQGGGSNTTCFNHAEDMPVSCTGGTITTDSFNGCRTIICTNGGDNLRILACDKPGVANAQYFEMYKQQQIGNSVSKICLGTTCIGDNGYVRSDNFPICIGGNSTPPSPPPPTPQNISFSSTTPTTNPTISEPNSQSFSYVLTNPSSLATTTTWRLNGIVQASTGTTYQFPGNYSTQGAYNVSVRVQSSQNIIQKDWTLTVLDTTVPVCVNSVGQATATCTGGSVTTDTLSGSCRTVTCTNGGDSLRILACNKPDTSTAQYFEMYKQQQIGNSVTQICLSGTCISNNGYAKSPNYPICT